MLRSSPDPDSSILNMSIYAVVSVLTFGTVVRRAHQGVARRGVLPLHFVGVLQHPKRTPDTFKLHSICLVLLKYCN